MGVELAPVEAMLDNTHPDLPTRRDHNAYILGSMGGHNVVVVVMHEIGNNAAATVASQLLNDFPSIRFGLLVGIGGGVPGDEAEHDIHLGDIVVSKPTDTFGGVVQYDLGKRLADGRFLRTGSLNKPPPLLSASVQKLQSRHLREGDKIGFYIDTMLERYPRMRARYSRPNEPDLLFLSSYHHVKDARTCDQCDHQYLAPRDSRLDEAPFIHYGTIASANLLIKNGTDRDALKQDMNVLCVEMEAAGLMNDFPCLVIRGICDYADSHKNKKWQPYAAAVAAAYMKELLLVIPWRGVLNSETVMDTTAAECPEVASAPTSQHETQSFEGPQPSDTDESARIWPPSTGQMSRESSRHCSNSAKDFLAHPVHDFLSENGEQQSGGIAEPRRFNTRVRFKRHEESNASEEESRARVAFTEALDPEERIRQRPHADIMAIRHRDRVNDQGGAASATSESSRAPSEGEIRLLNTETLRLEVMSFSQVEGKYAVLSYTHTTTGMFRKATAKAYEDSLRYIWATTPFEEQEQGEEKPEYTRRSLPMWLKGAAVCYVYLADFSLEDNDLSLPSLLRSIWFNRAWHLQDLLLPERVSFFDRQWHFLGAKSDLASHIEKVAGISEAYLTGDFRMACIAEKMSWVARRHAAVAEDMVFCMLGIFEVEIRQDYGNPEQAFRRLLRKLIEKYPTDESIYAWKFPSDRRFDALKQKHKEYGLFAPWISCFRESQGITISPPQSSVVRQTPAFQIDPRYAGIDIKVELQLLSSRRSIYYLALNCWDRGGKRIVIQFEDVVTTERYNLKNHKGWRRVLLSEQTSEEFALDMGSRFFPGADLFRSRLPRPPYYVARVVGKEDSLARDLLMLDGYDKVG